MPLLSIIMFLHGHILIFMYVFKIIEKEMIFNICEILCNSYPCVTRFYNISCRLGRSPLLKALTRVFKYVYEVIKLYSLLYENLWELAKHSRCYRLYLNLVQWEVKRGMTLNPKTIFDVNYRLMAIMSSLFAPRLTRLNTEIKHGYGNLYPKLTIKISIYKYYNMHRYF